MGNGYLALTRREGEKLFFFIEDSNGTITKIRIDLNEITGNQVKIGIDAPKTVQIIRDELLSK
ncbi:carbon storage regulator [Alkalimarinus alittae]|uniref:Carbon storage regulator n=1 Tax=Alkalimarinus alittae TaxID=2961619 RepID=A0ABY6N5D6_9ALTE|nr:carbon storage regulator [Alkalimarinus alittae]UZE97224.1 carbon storage regulator [Alkalimarinus alittae]